MSRQAKITCVLATRREDDRASESWLRLLRDVDTSTQLTAHILDRTPSGCIESELEKVGWVPAESRLHVVRQGDDAPIRDVWLAIHALNPDWLVTVADDDSWSGLSTLDPPTDTSVSVVAPELVLESEGGSTHLPKGRIQTHHVLHGLLRRDVVQTISSYMSEAPTPWGGEDLLMLHVAEQFGRIEESSGYRYYWNTRNWDGSTQDDVLRGYLLRAGWGSMANLSTYLLCQSLDRVAVAAYAREQLPEARWRHMVQAALQQFWPVTDPGHHRTFRRLPAPVRRAVLESRGLSGRRRVASILANSAAHAVRTAKAQTLLEAYSSGKRLVEDTGQILGSLLPALRSVSPRETHQQIDYWSECVATVDRLYRTEGQRHQGCPCHHIPSR